MDDPRVLDYRTGATAGTARVGGKALALARIARWGYPAPRGVIVTADDDAAVRAKTASVRAKLQAVDGAGVELALAEVRSVIVGTPHDSAFVAALETALARAGISDGLLAVRSSATLEDGAHTSFAGMHESILNVSGLASILKAVRQCQASLWTAHARAYRRRLGIADEQCLAAVLICEMVVEPGAMAPRAAGVAFTADPATGDRDTITVEAVTGLADALVQGRSSAARLSVNWRDRRRKFSGAPFPLDTAQTDRLIELLLRLHWLEAEDDRPVDVEWACAGGEIKIVQVRPITALRDRTFPALDGKPVIWSDANVAEVFPPALTPFTWSMVASGLRWTLFDAHRAAGYAIPSGMRIVRRRDRRVYLNMTAMQYAAYDAFGMAPSAFSRDMGGTHPDFEPPPGDPLAGSVGRARLARGLAMLRLAMGATRKTPRRLASLRNAADRLRARDLSVMESAQIAAEWRAFDASVVDAPIMEAAGAGPAFLAVAERMVAGRLDTEATTRVLSGLLAGSGGVASAEAAYELQKVGRALQTGAPDAEERWRNFLSASGHRGFCEMEIAHPRWREEPERLRELALAAARGPLGDERARAARYLGKQTLRTIPFWLRPGVSWAMARAARGYAMRETAKDTIVACLDVYRMIALESGRRLTLAGHLAQASDVFWLTGPDVRAFLERAWSGEEAATAVSDRKAAYAADMARAAPSWFVDSGGATAPGPEHDSPIPSTHDIRGVAASPGLARGRARLIADPVATGDLRPTDILVARVTDPAWTPLFLAVAGVVAETGGYLSHAAIVAREFGVPAVVNASGAFSRLRDGETISVDGSSGWVRKLEPAGDAQ